MELGTQRPLLEGEKIAEFTSRSGKETCGKRMTDYVMLRKLHVLCKRWVGGILGMVHHFSEIAGCEF